MSIANLFEQNKYDLFCDSLTLHNGGSALNNYEESIVPTNVLGLSAPLSITLKMVRVGKMVTIEIPEFAGTTANPGTILTIGVLAAAFRPESEIRWFCGAILGGTVGEFLCALGIDGTLTVRQVADIAFPNATAITVRGNSISCFALV